MPVRSVRAPLLVSYTVQIVKPLPPPPRLNARPIAVSHMSSPLSLFISLYLPFSVCLAGKRWPATAPEGRTASSSRALHHLWTGIQQTAANVSFAGELHALNRSMRMFWNKLVANSLQEGHHRYVTVHAAGAPFNVHQVLGGVALTGWQCLRLGWLLDLQNKY